MDTCIAIIMYWPRLFLLFIGKQHCLHKKKFVGHTCNEFMQNFKIGSVTVFAVQLFNKIKRKKKKTTKNMKKHVSLYFPDVMWKYIYFW